MNGPAAAPAQRTGRSDLCPCGSGREFKQCCGAAHPAAASVSPPRGARPASLNFGPLSEAGKLREAAEALSHSMHGIRTTRPNAGNSAEAGRAAPVLRQTEAAQRFRRQGVGLVRAGKLPAAITALRQATRLDPADAGSHRALGLALLRSGRLAEATASFELAIALEEGVAIAHYRLAVAFDRQGLTEKAMAAYRRAVELMPEMAEGHRRLAAAARSRGRCRGSGGMLPPRRHRLSRHDDRPAERDRRAAARRRSAAGGGIGAAGDRARSRQRPAA